MVSPSQQAMMGRKIVASLKSMNYYQRLKLDTKNVTSNELGTALANRLASLKMSSASSSPETFAEAQSLIQEAFDALGDPEKRGVYDRSLNAAVEGAPKPVWRTTPVNETELLLGRYRIGEAIHQSSRATVYQADDTGLSRRVVVKQVRPELLQSAVYRRVVREEAELFARCTASNLVKILDHDLNSGATVLERMESDLRGSVTNKGCGPEHAIEILRDCLKGLAALHLHRIAHGRVDLSHILLDDRGGAKLTITPGMRGTFRALQPSRTAQHVAPELLNPAVFGQPGVASDVYSLGFVILELLSGKHFARRVSRSIIASSDTPESWLEWHASATEHLSSIDELIPGIPPALARLLRQMTRKQQQERFPNATECLKAMDGLLAAKSDGATESPSVAEMVPGNVVDVLGTPDQLHHVFESSEAIGWSQIVRSPSLLLRPETKQHRQFMLLVCLLSVVFVLAFNVSSESKQNKPMKSSSTTGSYERSGQLPPPIPEPVKNEGTPELGKDPVALGGPSGEKELGYRVTFDVKPHGRVKQVSSTRDGPQTSEQIVPQGSGTWLLKEGQYQLTCEDAIGKEFKTEMIVPAGTGELRWTILAPVVETIVIKEPPTDSKDNAEDSSSLVASRFPKYRYNNPPFDVVGVAERNKEQLRGKLKRFLTRYIREPKADLANVSEEVVSQLRPSDPRRSFCYALQALREHDIDLAIRLCYGSLDEAENYDVPFVLPVQLISRLECHRNRLQPAVATCRDVIRWVGSRQPTSSDDGFEHAMRDTAKWSGNVIGFIEAAYEHNTPTNVETESVVALLRYYCNEEQWNAFMESREHMRVLHTEYATRYHDWQLTDQRMRAWERDRRDLFRDYSRARVGQEAKPRNDDRTGRPTFPLYLSPNDAYKFVDTYSDYVKPESSTAPNLGAEPPRTIAKQKGAPPRQFISYQPLDATSLAHAALATIPYATAREAKNQETGTARKE